ncbi:G-protein coupled receptor family C group 6 member A-like [Bombina bombina]|uniref:G-protein coupled receptor family C group 6 member A-like n=1 Tax=Bombina bombina TaxID=8345 RepID=UPI00235AC88F|nr:G-protein coupled receptor family C group 6 member A-like [Bombina bombina]
MFGIIKSLYFLCFFNLDLAILHPCPHGAGARLQGDIMIGGLFPIHKEIFDLTNYTMPYDVICTGFDMRGFIRSLGMVHAIERINSLNWLPGITLGYEIYDTCADASKGLQETMRMIRMSNSSDRNTKFMCNYTSYTPFVKAVIGAGYSEVSISVARLLSFHLIPQISYASSAAILSDRRRFPSFLRTVPSDTLLTKALATLIRKFKWTYVGIISSDDDYGRSVLESLTNHFDDQLVCTAFKEKIPSDVGNPDMIIAIKKVLEKIKVSSAQAVILALKVPNVIELFTEAMKLNISRIWIAMDNWSTSREIATMTGINTVGHVLGFSFKNGEIPGFHKYLRTLHLDSNTINTFIEEYKHLRFGCTEEYKAYEHCLSVSPDNCFQSESIKFKSPMACKLANVSTASDDFVVNNIELDGSFSAYLAVTAIAKALKNILCSNGTCKINHDLHPWQLLQEVKKIRFSSYDEDIFFDSYGNANIGYDLLSWHYVNESMQFTVVGKYELHQSSINFNSSLIDWNTPDNKIPDSKCSMPCRPGQYKVHSDIRCCYNCSLCAEGYYSDGYDMNECIKCPFDQWSEKGSSYCKNRTIEYFHWKDPFAIILSSFAMVGFLLVVIVGIVFLKYFDTPAVKAAGGIYTCIMNISLLCSFASTGFFIGEPSDISCKIRQPLYGISFTLCVSCILIKSFRIVLAFELGKQIQYNIKLTYQPVLVITALTGCQVCVCTLWLLLKGPTVTKISHIPQILIVQCHEGSILGYGIMLGFTGFLAFVCFALAYKGRKLPDKYNEGRYITFSMLIYIFVWFSFIPIYLTTNGMYLPAVEVVAILASNYGVICCHLLPSCYIIFFKKVSNSRESYLQSIRSFSKARLSVSYLIPEIPHFQFTECPTSNFNSLYETRKRSRSY